MSDRTRKQSLAFTLGGGHEAEFTSVRAPAVNGPSLTLGATAPPRVAGGRAVEYAPLCRTPAPPPGSRSARAVATTTIALPTAIRIA